MLKWFDPPPPTSSTFIHTLYLHWWIRVAVLSWLLALVLVLALALDPTASFAALVSEPQIDPIPWPRRGRRSCHRA